jgi:large subunit ribosomal protein L5
MSDESKKQKAPKAAKEKAPKDKGGKDKPAKEKGGKQVEADAGPPPYPRLRKRYEEEVLPQLQQALGRANRLSLPRLQKIVINMGVGTAITEKKHLEDARSALTQIAAQKPVVTKARKSVAGFRLREGMEIGCKVTLRGNRMYEFLDRLISLALPRVRDFRGLNPSAFDGHGNYTLGLSEFLVFPELNPDKFPRAQGMDITLVTSVDNNDEARQLLSGMGMPFRSSERNQDAA